MARAFQMLLGLMGRLALGLLILLLFLYPVLVGAVAYGISSYWGTRDGLEIALIFGYLSLFLLPCYILGNAIVTFWRPKHTPIKDIMPSGLKPDELTEIWEKHQDVQMHFNGIELQIRNYAVTLLVAVTGAAAYAIKAPLTFTVASHTFSLALAVLPAGILGWSAFYFMDRLWYHKLLLGAVFQTLALEKLIPELQLSHSIGKESPINIGSKGIHSTEKIDLFYTAGLIFLILLTGVVLWQGLSPARASSETLVPKVALDGPGSSALPDKQLAPNKREIEKHKQDATVRPELKQEPEPKQGPKLRQKQEQVGRQKDKTCCCCCCEEPSHLTHPESPL
jgi:hypothetical protein